MLHAPTVRLSSLATLVVTTLVGVVALLPLTACTASVTTEPGGGSTATSTSYEDLVALFQEWREFEKPVFADGVYDYTAPAMEAQHRELADYQARLTAIDSSGWPIGQQVDHYVVRTEMNGLEFYHSALRPWARNPAFYVSIFSAESDVPAHEGPVIHGWIDTWTYDYPLDDESATELAASIGAIPAILEQARGNLVEDAADLWRMGIGAFEGQSAALARLGERVAGTSADLDAAIEGAIVASDEFAAWLEAELPSKNGLSGVGEDNYNWYMQNVHLVPYTWRDQLTMMRRELARSVASLKLEEHRNRNLPQQERISTAEDYNRLFNEAVTEYMAFLDGEDVYTVREYDDFALRERIGRFSPADGLRGFFSEVSYRDPLTMRTHGHHWFDLAMMENEPHASQIRRVPLLYNIWDSRAEGMATGMEEWMMHAGLFDDSPRSRELIWILVAQRAARAIGGLMMHGNEWTIQEAVDFAAEWTPRGYMPADSDTVWGEQHFYLTQPGYGTSYLVGKQMIEQHLAERAFQLGDEFTLEGFMDELHATGLIPMTLITWELTGNRPEMLDGVAR
jgi:hypothetical protein